MVTVGAGGGETTRVAVAVRVVVPLVPVTVRGYVPVGVVVAALTVMVEAPDVVTDGGLKLAVAFAGNPLTLNAIVPVNPPDGVAVTV